jgi:hypothetical protein
MRTADPFWNMRVEALQDLHVLPAPHLVPETKYSQNLLDIEEFMIIYTVCQYNLLLTDM